MCLNVLVRCVAVHCCVINGYREREQAGPAPVTLSYTAECTGHGRRVGSLTLDNSLTRVSTEKGIQTGVMHLVLTLVYSNSRGRRAGRARQQHKQAVALQTAL